MDDPGHALAGGDRRLFPQFRQPMSTWHDHVATWLDLPDFPVHLVRYEDLSAAPEATVAEAARFLGLPDDGGLVGDAVRNASFDELRRQEEEDGFDERPPAASTFFREGRSGGWRDVLDDGQVSTLVAHHGPMMARLGYLDGDGNPR